MKSSSEIDTDRGIIVSVLNKAKGVRGQRLPVYRVARAYLNKGKLLS